MPYSCVVRLFCVISHSCCASGLLPRPFCAAHSKGTIAFKTLRVLEDQPFNTQATKLLNRSVRDPLRPAPAPSWTTWTT